MEQFKDATTALKTESHSYDPMVWEETKLTYPSDFQRIEQKEDYRMLVALSARTFLMTV